MLLNCYTRTPNRAATVLEVGTWQVVFFATLCSSILSQFAQPSGMKLIKNHVRDEDAQSCMSLLQTVTSVFMVLGPILGTLVYQQFGIEFSILTTGACFLLSAVALFFVPSDHNPPIYRETNKSFLMIGLLVNGSGIILAGLSTEKWLTMTAQFMIALLQPAIFVGNSALVMQHTDQNFIGRVMGIRTPLMTGAMLLMMGLAGGLKNTLSLPVVYEIAGCCFFAGFLIMIPLFRSKGHRERSAT
ncbi:MFS transporter [Cohnella caldifontis]|uniref:MFS transporter n=1 Tax=Cohnella caldifontis TaxID=3027471 RepID=UPI003BB62D78